MTWRGEKLVGLVRVGELQTLGQWWDWLGWLVGW